MSRRVKIIIFALVLIGAIGKKYLFDQNRVDDDQYKSKIDTSIYNKYNSDEKKSSEEKVSQYEIDELLKTSDLEIHPSPRNGFSPYDSYFGKGLYNNSSGNEFVIKNSNSTDAIVLLVNAFTGRKVRNEFIRKGSTFSMTGVPNGTYYLEWASGNNWSPNKRVGKLTGGFQTDVSFTKTRDRNDWMTVSGYEQWTLTLYAVQGGDVESENLTENEFGN